MKSNTSSNLGAIFNRQKSSVKDERFPSIEVANIFKYYKINREQSCQCSYFILPICMHDNFYFQSECKFRISFGLN